MQAGKIPDKDFDEYAVSVLIIIWSVFKYIPDPIKHLFFSLGWTGLLQK